MNPSVDGDLDGFYACEDCNDNNADISPAITEIFYDDIDQNCDGLSDYDADGDGYDAMEYEDSSGNIVSYSGSDCDDGDEDLHPAYMEDNPTNVLQDADGICSWQ